MQACHDALTRQAPIDIPADKTDQADQHSECVMIDIPALQRTCHPREPLCQGSNTVRSNTVNQRSIAGLPKVPAEDKSRFHQDPVIKFVEIPFIEGDLV